MKIFVFALLVAMALPCTYRYTSNATVAEEIALWGPAITLSVRPAAVYLLLQWLCGPSATNTTPVQ